MTNMPSPVLTSARGAGAHIDIYGNWQLPAGFGNPIPEYESVHQTSAVHDSSYLGRIKATGVDVLDLVNRLSTNKVDNLAPGSGAPTILTNDKGRILDLIYLFNLGSYILILTSPNREQAVIDWLDKFTFVEDISTENITARTAMVTLAGPNSPHILQNIFPEIGTTPLPLTSMEVATNHIGATVLALEMIGTTGFHIITPFEDAESIWNSATNRGSIPVGEDVWQILRVESGVPIYGKELGESFNPLETGLIGGVDFAKGCYIGQEVIARLDTYDKDQRSLTRLFLDTEQPVEEGLKLVSDGREVGLLTSLARIPTTGKLLGLGYVRRVIAEPGQRLCLAGNDSPCVEILDIPLLLGEERI